MALDPFPDIETADNDGLLAVGGDLSEERLIMAYKNGIFPWYSNGQPILWWCPDPRMVLYTKEVKISKSMQKVMNDGQFQFSIDRAFEEVMLNCAHVDRKGEHGTWITDEIMQAYAGLHQNGNAHSVEVWQGQELVGGLYGVSLGSMFFGESMFHKVSNASKAGFIHFAQWGAKHGIDIIDCQIESDHLSSLGARNIPRKEFNFQMKAAIQQPFSGEWAF